MTLGPQFEQLQMLMTGSELKRYLTDSTDRDINDDDSVEPMDSMWERKEAESKEQKGSGHGSGVYDSLREYGYSNNPMAKTDPSTPGGPLNVLHRGSTLRFLYDGHHRVAAAAALEGERQIFLPVWHHEVDEYANTPSRIRKSG